MEATICWMNGERPREQAAWLWGPYGHSFRDGVVHELREHRGGSGLHSISSMLSDTGLPSLDKYGTLHGVHWLSYQSQAACDLTITNDQASSQTHFHTTPRRPSFPVAIRHAPKLSGVPPNALTTTQHRPLVRPCTANTPSSTIISHFSGRSPGAKPVPP